MTSIHFSDHSGSQSSLRSTLVRLNDKKKLERSLTSSIGGGTVFLKRQGCKNLDDTSSFKTDSDMCEMQKGDLDMSELELASNDIKFLGSETMNDSYQS